MVGRTLILILLMASVAPSAQALSVLIPEISLPDAPTRIEITIDAPETISRVAGAAGDAADAILEPLEGSDVPASRVPPPSIADDAPAPHDGDATGPASTGPAAVATVSFVQVAALALGLVGIVVGLAVARRRGAPSGVLRAAMRALLVLAAAASGWDAWTNGVVGTAAFAIFVLMWASLVTAAFALRTPRLRHVLALRPPARTD